MELETEDRQAVRRQLERVLSGSRFVRSERLSHFLRFVVERRLEGKNGGSKESLIAIEVFGRQADHDPRDWVLPSTLMPRTQGVATLGNRILQVERQRVPTLLVERRFLSRF